MARRRTRAKTREQVAYERMISAMPSAYSPIVGGTPFDNIDWGQVVQNAQDATRAANRSAQSDYFNSLRAGTEGVLRSHKVGKYTRRDLSTLDKLYQRVEKQKAQAARVGLNAEEARKPSLLERIFDVMSRGQYASASAAMNELKTRQAPGETTLERGGSKIVDPIGSLKAAWEGLTGRSKLSYSDVIEQAGVRGDDRVSRSVRGIGGFAGDVALDPTTYVGVGAIKKISKEAIENAGVTAARQAFKSPESMKAGRNAVSLATRANRGRALKRSEQIRIHNEAVADSLSLISKKAREEAAEAAPGRFAFRILGEEVATRSGIGRKFSESAYRNVAKVGNMIGETNAGQAVQRAFNPRATAPGRLHMYQRIFHGRGVSDLQYGIKEWRKATQTLSKADSENITKALEEGTDLAGMLDEAGKTDLGDIASQARAMLDDMFKNEFMWGYYTKPGEYMDKYLPKYARKGITASRKKFHDATKKTIDEAAEEFGVTPIKDIRDLVARRATLHYRRKAQYQLVKELETEYGLKIVGKKNVKLGIDTATAKKLGLKKIPHKTADVQVAVPRAVHDFVEEMGKLMTDPEYAADMLKIYDSMLNSWKTAVTVVNPGFHVRNTIGDIYLNWMAGVNKPGPYQKAIKILSGTSQPAGEIAQKVQRQLPKALQPGQQQTVKLAGQSVSVDDIKYLYHQAGLNVGFFREELGKAPKGLETLRKASEARENWVRMTNFVDKLEKAVAKGGIKLKGKDPKQVLAKAALEAGEKVRKFNIDYGDLTTFEKAAGKRVLPFYTWVRKSTPLLVESLFTQPGKIASLPKGKAAIERILGTDKRDEDIENTIPKWLTDYSALRIAGGDNPEFLGGGAVLPIQTFGEFSGMKDIPRYFAGMSSPAAQIPFELSTGREIFSGREVDDNVLTYLSGKTPYTRLAGKQERGQMEPRDIINMLSGIGYQDVPEYRKTGELYRQEEILRKILKKKKKDLEEELGE